MGAVEPTDPRRQTLARVLANPEQVKVLQRDYCQRRLSYFIKQAWPILEPQTSFAHAFYIDAICEHLEAMLRGEIGDLIINIPPRFLKSIISAVMFPAWAWMQAPHLRFIYSSYHHNLAKRDSRKCRTVIQSPWYQELWGDAFHLVSDQNEVMRYDNNQRGFRLATSMEGWGTGEGGDFVCVDDPISIMDAFSPRELEKAIEWWDQQMSSRIDNPKTGHRLIVMQRSAMNDLTGHVLKQGGYEHLMLPLEYEESRCCYTPVRPRYRAPLSGEDEQGKYRWDLRETEGESLNPARWGPAEIQRQKEKMVSAHAIAAQLQQRPAPRGGGMIKLDWFKRYRTPPAEFDYLVHSWDTANKGGQSNAFSVGGIWGIVNNLYYLLWVYRERMDIPQLERKIKQVGQYDSHGLPAAILIEDAASGTGVIQHLRQETTLPIIAIQVKGSAGDKETRMDIETPAIESGLVVLPEEAPWLLDFESEVQAFPNSENKDQVDQMSQFLKWMREGNRRMEEDDWYLI